MFGWIAGAAVAQCPPASVDPIWTDDFATVGLNDIVYSAAAWDPDGPGPLPERLVVGGAFTAAGETRLPRIAVLEDGLWTPLDPDSLPDTGYIPALAVADLDNDPGTAPALYAFVRKQDDQAVYENRGAGWTKLPPPLAQGISAMTEFDADGPGGAAPVLACGVDGEAMAQTWDGERWRLIGVSAPSTRVFTITRLPVADGELLILGGRFERDFGGEVARHIAAWDGSQWSALPGGPDDGDVTAVAAHDPDGTGPAPQALYATGRFGTIGGGIPAGVAKWDGTAWSAEPGDTPTFGDAMLSFDPDGFGPAQPVLVVGGAGISWLDAGGWHEGGATNNSTYAAAAIDFDGSGPQAPAVAVGGAFGSVYDSRFDAHSAPHMAVWDPAGGLRALGPSESRGLDRPADQLVAWRRPGKSPVIAARGLFYSAGATPAYRAALWDGVEWSAVPGLDSMLVTAIAAGSLGDDPEPELLLIGDDFGGVWSHDGETLTMLRTPSTSRRTVTVLEVHDADGVGPLGAELYMVDSVYDQIYRMDKVLGWVQLPESGAVTLYDMRSYDADGSGPGLPVLVVAGRFPESYARLWNGNMWISMPGEGRIEHLLVVPGDIGPAELFGAGGNGVWRWSGADWVRVGPKFGAGSLFEAEAIAAWPDASGGYRLFAAGEPSFTSTNLARFDGENWVAAAPPRDAPGSALDINALLAIPCGGDLPPGLYAGGDFTRFADQSAMHIGRAVFRDLCYADCDHDGELTFFDFLCFQNQFAAGDPAADCDGDGSLTFFDFLCFQNAFAAGCP
ncbi:MAG: GC-type dockerin domain-anchored protein [Phycisphaerales bacterium JB039]